MNSVKKQSRYRNPIKTPNLHLIKKKAGKFRPLISIFED
jgi:hypothetical protein